MKNWNKNGETVEKKWKEKLKKKKKILIYILITDELCRINIKT